MSNQMWIGIDVSKTSLDLDSYPCQKYQSYTNTAMGISKLVSQCLKKQPALIVMGTGGNSDVTVIGGKQVVNTVNSTNSTESPNTVNNSVNQSNTSGNTQTIAP